MDDYDYWPCMASCFLIGVVAGMLLLACVADHQWRMNAIKHEAAHFNAKTGAFEWNQ